MRVLLSAYACEPGQGSEPGTGWSWARAAAQRHDVWLLTRANLAESIEEARSREPELRLHPVYVDLPQWARRWKHGQRGVHWYYLLWQVAAWRQARRLHHRIRFDLAHHVTFASDWMPAGVAYVRGVPTIWGPVGGATGVPWRLWRWLGARGCLAGAGRDLATRPARRVFGTLNARRAALVVAQNEDVARAFRHSRRTIVIEPHVAIDVPAGSHNEPRATTRSAGRQAVFAGRLVPWKGVALAVAALAQPAAAEWSLDIYGAGPEARRVAILAARLGVADRVVLRGQRPRAEVLAALSTADALLFPSMHDSAPWIVAEALSRGCPVVCLDRGGPAVIVGAGEGMKVGVSADTVGALAGALRSLKGRIPPVSRWAADRLPSLLATWYEQVGRHSSGAASVSTLPTATHYRSRSE
jgi:glycosyltransferase involved in cell wall biosynthesis